MVLPKSLTTVTLFSKALAALLFILFPLIGFQYGMMYQQSIKNTSKEAVIPPPTPTQPPISSPSKTSWNRYMSKNLDYYIDYPKTFGYAEESENTVSFEKRVDYPHKTNCWIFINDEIFSKEELSILSKMSLGEARVVKKDENTLPNKFNIYKRLPDITLGSKTAKSFVNSQVWEGDHLYVYVYEEQGKSPFVFGGFTREDKEQDSISYAELQEVVFTLRFLD